MTSWIVTSMSRSGPTPESRDFSLLSSLQRSVGKGKYEDPVVVFVPDTGLRIKLTTGSLEKLMNNPCYDVVVNYVQLQT